MVRIDLKDAYLAIPISTQHRKYLRFCWRGQTYEFTCLPFGLAVAPCVFTKVIKPVVGFIRSKGVWCVVYIDDFLLML